VLLLLGGAYWAALPWLGCELTFARDLLGMTRFCTFGTGIAGFQGGGFLLNLVVGLTYVAAAFWVASTRRLGI
jgi:hypothetical protein